MRLYIIALLFAISYAQTEKCRAFQFKAKQCYGGDIACWNQADHTDYVAMTAYNECDENCKVITGVPDAKRCHDLVKEFCTDQGATHFAWRTTDGRCWAKSREGECTWSDIYWAHFIHEHYCYCNIGDVVDDECGAGNVCVEPGRWERPELDCDAFPQCDTCIKRAREEENAVELPPAFEPYPVTFDDGTPQILPSCDADVPDEWYRKDCSVIKKKGDCFAYYSHCQTTCGCPDFDVHQARLDNGVVDSLVTGNFQCVEGPGFTDSRGFSCDVYEGAKWCENQNGQIVEGDGWCHRWPRDYANARIAPCKVMPGRERMYSFAHYANDAGQDARTCCCNTGIADQYPYDLGWDSADGAQCNDKTFFDGNPWHDKYGYSCRAYYFGNMCKPDGAKGDGWEFRLGTTIADYPAYGMNAKQACCACGGGFDRPHYDTIPGVLLRRMDKYIDQGMDSTHWNRISKFARSIVNREDSFYGYDPARKAYITNIFDITKGRYTEAAWDLMMVEWNGLKTHYPEFNWLNNKN